MLDHVAIAVADFDDRLAFLTGELGLCLRRMGRLNADPGRRIAMLADNRGVKIELVEAGAAGPDALLHLAFDTGTADGVDAAFAALVGAGCDGTAEPARFEPARSRTATVRRAGGGVYQLVAYDAGSTDAAEVPGA